MRVQRRNHHPHGRGRTVRPLCRSRSASVRADHRAGSVPSLRVLLHPFNHLVRRSRSGGLPPGARTGAGPTGFRARPDHGHTRGGGSASGPFQHAMANRRSEVPHRDVSSRSHRSQRRPDESRQTRRTKRLFRGHSDVRGSALLAVRRPRRERRTLRRTTQKHLYPQLGSPDRSHVLQPGLGRSAYRPVPD